MRVCAKVGIQFKIKLHNFRIQMFANIWNRSTSNKRAVKSLQYRQKLSSQVLRQKMGIWTCVGLNYLVSVPEFPCKHHCFRCFMPLVFKIELQSSNPGKHEFPHSCVETEAFMVNKMFKTQQKYLEFCLVQTKCFSVGFQWLLQPVRKNFRI